MSKSTLAIASTLGLDYESSRAFENEYRYQSTRTKKPIYCDGNDYWCISATKPTDEVGTDWVMHTDQFWAKKIDKILWVSRRG